jgi:hypothetical protein
MFLNCTAHELTLDQKEQANKYSPTILDLNSDNVDLHTKLVNCPPDVEIIQNLVKEFFQYLKEKYKEAKGDLTLHMPIGSPAFMAIFFMKLDREKNPCRILFSHSDRLSIEEKQADGSVIKRGVFRFVKFIEV